MANNAVERSKLLGISNEYRLDPDQPIELAEDGRRSAWKKIGLAVGLLCLGTLLLCLGIGFWFTGRPNCEYQ